MRKLFIFFILIVVSIPLIGQINKDGIHFIRNYTREEYNAAEQNWAVCEDNRGVMYFGNNEDGVLEFDGVNWRKIPIRNNSHVRSLEVDSLGTVYVGCVNEFGYLKPNFIGEMEYHSLSDELPDSISFKDVWRTYVVDENIYFGSQKYLFKVKDRELIKIIRNPDIGSFISFAVNDRIYWGNYYEGLQEVVEDSIFLAIGGEYFKNMDIFVILPFTNNRIFIGTRWSGAFVYNQVTGEAKELDDFGKKHKQLNDFFKANQLYNGIKLKDGTYALATLANGCIIADTTGNILHHYSEHNGLQAVTVVCPYQSTDGTLWLGLVNGISNIELSAPFKRFGSDYGIQGIPLDIVEYNEVLYVATTIGLYYRYFEDGLYPKFKMVPGTEQKLNWSLDIFKLSDNKKVLLLASDYGIFRVYSPNKVVQLNKNDQNHFYNAECIYQSIFNKDIFYIGHSTGLAMIEYKKGKWLDHGKLNTDLLDYEIEAIVEAENGNLWMSTPLNGIIKYNPDRTENLSDTAYFYGIDEGLPFIEQNKIAKIGEDLVVSTRKGIFYYNFNNDSFERYKGFGEERCLLDDQVKKIINEGDSAVWILSKSAEIGNEIIERCTIGNNELKSEKKYFDRLNNFAIQNVYINNKENVWIATSDGIFSYDLGYESIYEKDFHALIRQVHIGVDSLVFFGTNYTDTSNYYQCIQQPEILKPNLRYKYNSLKFHFAAPHFPNEEMLYSYMLEGYDESWSPWSGEKTDKEYTNLDNKSKYVFKVKAKNIYGEESAIAEYEFSVLPPWYKTIVAYLGYIVLSVVVIIIIVKVYTRRLELEKIRLEQIVRERTEEVVKQKEEIEMQRDEISEKNRNITDSIEYASRIQKAILPSDKYADEILPEHFILFHPRDIVSGDFYWMTKKDNLVVVIAADCTGHGVPGAFMSMLGVSFLNEIVNKHEITTANVILNQLRADVKNTLDQTGKEGEAKDGMDIALCIVDMEKMKMQFAGAYNPLYLIRDGELIQVKADRMPIGIYIKEKESFTNHEVDIQKGDTFYIFSDGYVDQFGGERGDKLKSKRFKEILLSIQDKNMLEQKQILDKELYDWMGDIEQVDDIIVLGVRI